MPKYISGRSKKTPQSALPADRYRYLSVSDSEPNLGDTPTDQGSPSLPSGQQYIVVGFRDRPGERFWIPNQGGIIPGSLSIFEENTLVGGLSSTTQLNFVGNAIAATGTSGPPPGVAVTITVAPPGFDNSVLFKDSGDFATDARFTFDNGLFAAGDRITVGTGGTVITTTTGIGSVGIGTTEPTQRLHLHDGNFRITGTIYDSTNQPGNLGNLIVKGASGGLLWVSPNTVQSGAGGTIGQVQFHNTAGLVDGADNFYFDFNNNRVGIGSTQPTQLLDVLGISTFSGGVFVDNLYADRLEVSGISTIPKITGITTFIQTNDNILGDPNTGAVQFDGGVGINKNLTVGLGITAQDLNIAGIATIQTLEITSLEIEDLTVTGISTLGNVVVDTNTIKTKPGSGNLILDSDGIVQVTDPLYVSGATESTSKDNGSIITEGGIGVEKSVNIGLKLNVGGAVSFTGPSVGIAVTLAGAGGITTTGGDLYVNGNVLPSHNATSNNDPSGKDIGASNTNWRRIYAQEFVGSFIGIADTATNLAGGATGSIPYQSAPDTTVFLAEPDADNKVLSYNNTSDAPIWIDLDKIQEGNTSAEVVDTGTNGHFKVLTEGTEKFRILSNGRVNFYDASSSQYYGSIFKSGSALELLGYSNLNLSADGTKISIDQTGVGIGSTQPTVELDVNGKVALGSSVYDSNGSTGSNQQILSSAPGIGVSWASLQDIAITIDKIQEDNTSAEVVDTGTNGHFKVLTEGTEKFRIGPTGIATFFGNGTATITSPSDLNLNANTVAISTDITIGGKIGLVGTGVSYGGLNQVLTSNGPNAAPTWQNSSGSSGISSDKISEGNTSAEVVDTGSNGHFKVLTEGTERFRIGPAGIATFNNDVKFPNDTKALFGSVTGLEIYHASSDNDSYIQKGTEGNLRIQTDQLFLRNRVGSEYMMIANGNGKVELYYDGVPKFQTTGAGITVTGISSASEGFNIGVHSAGTPVTTGSVKTLNFSGTGNVITYDASTKTVDIDSGSGGGGSGISSDRIFEGNTSAEVVDTGTNGHFKVLTEGTEKLRVTGIGSVGIGTDDPIRKLHVEGTVRISRSAYNSFNPHLELLVEDNDEGNGGMICVKHPSQYQDLEFKSITSGSSVDLFQGVVGELAGSSYYSGLKVLDNRALLLGTSCDGVITYDSNGFLEIKTTVNEPITFSTNDTERLRIGSSGQFGLSGANYGTSGQVLTSNGSSSAPTWQTVSGGGGGGVQDKIQEGNTSAEVVDTGNNGHFKVITEGTERLRVTSDGNLGIGTDTVPNNFRVEIANDGVSTGLNLRNTNDSVGDICRIAFSQGSGNLISGNTFADIYAVTDSVSPLTGHIEFRTNEGNNLSEKLRIGSAGQIGLSGANYGSSGQVLTSNGASSAPTWQNASGGGGGGVQDKIEEGNTSAEVVDTGTNGHFKVLTEGTERFRIGSAGIATFNGNVTLGTNASNIVTFNADIASALIPDNNATRGLGASSARWGTLFVNNINATGILTAGGLTYPNSNGTSGYVLTSDGAGNITWEASTGGGGGAYDNTTWILGSNGASDYTFTGPGLTGAENDPTIYVVRGQKYRFINNSGGSHPFEIRYNSNGTAYSEGVTNNGASSGNIDWNVQFDAPDVLYYQCTNHSGMLGKIIILGDVVSEGSWTASAGSAQTIDTITGVANNAIKTAEYVIHIENGSNMQAQKVLVMQDGTTAYSQEYAIMDKSGLLVSMSATISGGNLLLQATPETGVSGTTTYKITRQTMR